MARPTKLNPEAQALICNAIRFGLHAETAAQLIHVDKKTLYRWVRRGQTESIGPYAELVQEVARAEAEAETKCVGRIVEASERHWKAAAWLLARRWPERWASRKTVAVEVQKGVEQVLDLVEPHMKPDSWAEFVQAIAVVTGLEGAEPQPLTATH